MGATQPEMTRANQAVISKTCSGSLVFLMQSGWGGAKERSERCDSGGLVACFLFI